MTIEHTHRLNRILAQLANVEVREITDYTGIPVEPYFWVVFDDNESIIGLWDPLFNAAQMDLVLRRVEGHLS